jgi:hypothetical protein
MHFNIDVANNIFLRFYVSTVWDEVSSDVDDLIDGTSRHYTYSYTHLNLW